jgi:regulator of replication initiation timing
MVLAGLALVGCDAREKELEKEAVLMHSKMDSLQAVIGSRDAYFDEIVASINAVYTDLEGVRQTEEQIRLEAGKQEGGVSATSTSNQSRVDLLNQVEKIGNSLQESRKQIARLEKKVGSLSRESKGLNEMVASLKQQLAEREQTIAMLETDLGDLKNQVAEKSNQIVERDAIIQAKDTELNTVYYITGTRDELEELGILDDEGGFLGLGSTSVLASGVDESLFNRFDMTGDRSITVEGEIEEIVPKRSEQYYQSENGEESSNLQILNPDKFWQERYLVIITG